jgi:hypothetical protein
MKEQTKKCISKDRNTVHSPDMGVDMSDNRCSEYLW